MPNVPQQPGPATAPGRKLLVKSKPFIVAAAAAAAATTTTTTTTTTTIQEEEHANSLQLQLQLPLEESSCNSAEELDLAMDGNAPEMFVQFCRQAWPLVRSLPEVLHHAPRIVQLVADHVLSPSRRRRLADKDDDASSSTTTTATAVVSVYEINHATTDILHLLAVLARDLRHGIHPCVPQQQQQQTIECHRGGIRLSDSVVHCDSEAPLNEVVVKSTGNKNKKKQHSSAACLEPMRQYYGLTVAHSQDWVRRLATETFCPLIRKLRTDSGVAKTAFAARLARTDASRNQRLQAHAVDGIAQLLFQVAKGVERRLYSKMGEKVILPAFWKVSTARMTTKKKNKKNVANDHQNQLPPLLAMPWWCETRP